MSQETVTINGVEYDAQSGLPLTAAATASTPVAFTPHKQSRPSQSVHQATEKSHTLNRRIVKKATPVTAESAPKQTQSISKFAPHPSATKQPVKMMDFRAQKRTAPLPTLHSAKKSLDIAPTVNVPVAVKPPAAVAPTPKAPAAAIITPAATPSQVLKQQEIDKAMATPAKKESKRRKLAKKTNKNSRVMSVASASLALLMLGGYFTYLNMPSLSVRVAAAQAGVDATYPAYRPDGYSVNGLVTYSEGAVSMKFAANGGPQSFTIDQTKKNWDSSAVLENYVKPKSGGSYIPYSEQGLTIYTFDNNAAWVNGGVLYTISGDAPLSSEQILHIASSM